MKISLHQPNFFPYYPFFQKMEACDVFVLMYHCQYEKRNYQNRFNIGDKFYTMSVNRGTVVQENSSHGDLIISKRYLNHEKDWLTIKNKLPNFRHILDKFDDCISQSLVETNISIILRIKELLQIKTKVVFDFPTSKKSTDRIIEICQAYNGDEYLSGISGKNYLDLNSFTNSGLGIEFQKSEEMENVPILQKLNQTKK